ncbi:hypothetical protein XELAEV_18005033mg [Xenopus laevis]|uniref:Uncharacterized protein n=1 Tax=Xenopus laevis TaxID=8355 RepID=A0A974DYF0_XENLA|nr:hypothetical protein XELAEV_18005033mg [Xenopus laevis]
MVLQYIQSMSMLCYEPIGGTSTQTHVHRRGEGKSTFPPKVDFPRQTKDTRTKGTSPGNIHTHRHSDVSMACKVHLCSMVRIPQSQPAPHPACCSHA